MTEASDPQTRLAERSTTTLLDLPAVAGGPDPVAPTRNWRAENALALMGLGAFLLLPATVTVAAKAMVIAGLPLIWIYLFGVWLLLIVGAAALARRGVAWSEEADEFDDPAARQRSEPSAHGSERKGAPDAFEAHRREGAAGGGRS